VRKSPTHAFERRQVRLPDEVWQDARRIAVERNQSLSEVVLEAMTAHISREKKSMAKVWK
jgi:predicted transcriptional regulator